MNNQSINQSINQSVPQQEVCDAVRRTPLDNAPREDALLNRVCKILIDNHVFISIIIKMCIHRLQPQSLPEFDHRHTAEGRNSRLPTEVLPASGAIKHPKEDFGVSRRCGGTSPTAETEGFGWMDDVAIIAESESYWDNDREYYNHTPRTG